MIALLLCAALSGAQDLVVKGAEVRPVAGPPIADGVVVVRAGRIAAIGPAGSVQIPEGVVVVEGAVVTPGLVDGLTQVGLTGVFNSASDQDHLETDRAVRPELRALDGYNPWEELVGWLRAHGVTTAQVGPSPGGLVSGRTAVVRLTSGTPDQVARVADGMVVFTLGEATRNQIDGGPRTRMGSAAGIRQALAGAAEYRERRKLPLADRPPQDLGQDALVDLLEGRRTAVFVAHRADDLLGALRIAGEFQLRAVLAGATEGYLVRDAIAAARVPVLVGPVMGRSWSQEGETANASFENAALLADAGVPIGFTGGFEDYVPKVRVVLWEAAVAAANGLGPERALDALTRGGARILGVDGEVGTLEVGRGADLAVFDGDPFEYGSHVCAVVIDGRVVSDGCR